MNISNQYSIVSTFNAANGNADYVQVEETRKLMVNMHWFPHSEHSREKYLFSTYDLFGSRFNDCYEITKIICSNGSIRVSDPYEGELSEEENPFDFKLYRDTLTKAISYKIHMTDEESNFSSRRLNSKIACMLYPSPIIRQNSHDSGLYFYLSIDEYVMDDVTPTYGIGFALSIDAQFTLRYKRGDNVERVYGLSCHW